MPPPRELHPFVRAVAGPLRAFFQLEAVSAILLFAAALVALLWANSPLGPSYRALFGQRFTWMTLGSVRLELSLSELINDGLMSIFFFLVGMEIKRELVLGELRVKSKAVLPAVAALGGMILPAMVYAAFNMGKEGAPGWAIPVATDIAFAIGCLTLVKNRIPSALIVFITALAIFDDIGGILIIAFFYGHGLHLLGLIATALVTLLLLAVARAHTTQGVVYVLLGLLLWCAVHTSGIHATISGVILGLVIPIHSNPTETEEASLRRTSPLHRFVHALHPWVAFGVMPLFALANSGVDLSGAKLSYLIQPVLLGTALGLFVGKQLGIFFFTMLAVRLGLAPRPGGAPAAQVYGVSVVAGIGFTIALFIADLAFHNNARLLDEAKLGILIGSLISGLSGYILLRAYPRSPA